MPVKTKPQATKPTTTSKPAKELTKSMLISGRDEVRELVYSSEDNREFKPLDLALVAPLVIPNDKAKFESLLQSGENGVIEIDLNIDDEAAIKFLRGWLQANGKNRTPKPTHYGYLADKFRQGFSPDATNWVLDSNGMVANGGHSGRATVLAFYPVSVEYGIQGSPIKVKGEDSKESTIPADSELGQQYLDEEQYGDEDIFVENYYYDHDGIVYESTPLVWKTDGSNQRVGEYDDKGNYIEGTDDVSIRQSQDLRISLRINADPKSCLKMDDVRLEASFDDFLEMVAPIRAHIATLPAKVAEVCGTLFRNYYLRVNHKADSFGSLGKGGRLTKSDVQQWYIAGIPQLLDCVELLLNTAKTDIQTFPHFQSTKVSGTKGGVALMHALVAMMVCDETGRKRIAKLLTSFYTNYSDAPTEFKSLVEFILKPKNSPESPASADQIVQALVFVGNGTKDAVAAMRAAYPDPKATGDNATGLNPWQVESNRSAGWDRSNTDSLDDGSEDFTSVCINAAERIATILGNEGNVQNAKMKATRKGLGARGKNKGK